MWMNSPLCCNVQTDDVLCLRAILDMLSEVTGLRINFLKSTVVPCTYRPRGYGSCYECCSAKEASFPQVYLGLTLSNIQLNLKAFGPLIAKVDKRLAGWKALLLSTMLLVRVTLTNSVLGTGCLHTSCHCDVAGSKACQDMDITHESNIVAFHRRIRQLTLS